MLKMSDDQTRSPLVPYLSVRGGKDALAFYRKAFNAETADIYEYEGKIGHAAMTINGAALYLADEFPDMETMTGNVAPPSLGGRTTFTVSLNVGDADAWYERACENGCETLRAPSDEFFGRHAKVRDPFGHVWSFVSHAPCDQDPSTPK